jgi:predicted nucleic acid-binding protein
VIWALDSNVLVDAIRQPQMRTALIAFLDRGAEVALSSVVVAELEFGARTPKARRLLEHGILEPVSRRGMVRAPAEKDWQHMGRLLSDHPEWARTASRQNDVLLGIQSAANGWTLVTRDRDFTELRRHVPALRTVLAFPDPNGT